MIKLNLCVNLNNDSGAPIIVRPRVNTAIVYTNIRANCSVFLICH